MGPTKKFNIFWANKWDSYCLKRREMGLEDMVKREEYNYHLSKEQKQLVDDFYLAYYGAKIGYWWHEFYTSYTEVFDVQYIPAMLYMAEFEKFENFLQEYRTILVDKNQFKFWARGINVVTPETILWKSSGLYYKSGVVHSLSSNNFMGQLYDIGKVFLKPAVDVHGGGQGCILADFKAGYDQISGHSVEHVIGTFSTDFVVQEYLQQHESLSQLYAGSVNTFRIGTYRWRDRFYFGPVVLRIGTGISYIDNVSSGGIFVAVNDDGTLHNKAYVKHNTISYDCHPDTGIKFSAYRIKEVPKLIDMALYCHRQIPKLGSINWDFTISHDGYPVLIEANARNQGCAAEMGQKAHGKAFFGDRTAEILRWLRVVKKTPLSKRKQYMFGYGLD